MAFKPLPQSQPHRRAPLTVPTLAVRKNNQSSLCIPRALLRDAGLPDIPGARFDVLVGEGSDAGSIAIIAGSRYAGISTSGTATPTTLQISFSGLVPPNTGKVSATKCRYEAGRKQLIVHVPPGYPLASEQQPVSNVRPVSAPDFAAVFA